MGRPQNKMRLGPEKTRMINLALESIVISHGLPYPQNLETARELEAVARSRGVEPKTIAVLGGEIKIGLSDAELERLAKARDVMKLARRDIAAAIANKRDGATTVSATMFLAHRAGIRVFATGGIGGVHRALKDEGGRQKDEKVSSSLILHAERSSFSLPLDISADLTELAQTPVAVVCAGAKAILDLPATLEFLETHSVPVLGYQTDDLPAFYSRASGLRVPVCVDSAEHAAKIIQAHWELGNTSGVLVCVPIPREDEIPREVIEPFIARVQREAEEKKITGGALTPFLLARLAELTEGKTVRANIALLKNNVAVAADIAKALQVSGFQVSG
jgi:pseudouridine-5'-phosphate glycosidase